MALNFLTPAGLSLGGTGAYTTIDLSAVLPSGATGVALRVLNTSASLARAYGLRPFGSSDDFYQPIVRGSHMWEVVGLDAGRRFQIKRESTAIAAELVGWFDARATFFSSAPAIPLAQTNAHEAADLSALIPSGAAAAILLFTGSTSAEIYARATGATHALTGRLSRRQPFITGVSAGRSVDIYRGSTGVSVRLLGYISDGATVETPVDDTPASAGTWTDRTLPAGALGGWWWVVSGSTWGVRKDGSGLAWSAQSNVTGLGIAEAESETVETIIGSTSASNRIWRLGYFTAPGDDHVVQPVSLVSAPEFTAPSLDTEDDHEVSPVSLVSTPEFTAPSLAVAVDQRLEQILLIAHPFDPDATATLEGPPVPLGEGVFDDTAFTAEGAETSVYLADGRGGSYVSTSSDTPADQVFPPALRAGYTFNATAFSGARPGGQASESSGAIEILNTGSLDSLIDYAWDGRSVEIYRVRSGAALSTARLAFRGTVERIANWSDNSIVLGLRQRLAIFDRPLLTATYGGTGGLDGDVSVTGALKRQGYGQVQNAEGVLINAGLLIWQMHDGRIFAVDAVRDKGVPLDFSADYDDYDALAAASIGAGEYATCLAYGLIRLGASPDGRVTCDFRGDAAGGVYVDAAADIIERIATTRLSGANLASEEIDQTAFDALNAAQPASLQYYTGDRNPTVADVLTEIMGTVGGWYAFTREGLLTVRRLESPSSPTFTMDAANASAVSRMTVEREPPSWRERVEFGRPWVIQSGDDLAGSVSAEDRERWGRQRFAEARDTSIRQRHRLARSNETPALFVHESDAQAEADRLLNFWGIRRDRFTIRCGGQLFLRWLGDEGSIDMPAESGGSRYGLPKDAVVVGLFENARTGEVQLVMVG